MTPLLSSHAFTCHHHILCNLTSSQNVSTPAVLGPLVSNLTSYLILSHNITSHNISQHYTTSTHHQVEIIKTKSLNHNFISSLLISIRATNSYLTLCSMAEESRGTERNSRLAIKVRLCFFKFISLCALLFRSLVFIYLSSLRHFFLALKQMYMYVHFINHVHTHLNPLNDILHNQCNY